MTTSLIDTMRDADFVFIDGEIFKTRYLRVPDETTVPDDIVLEAEHDDSEIELTQYDIEQPKALEAGFYQLKNGMIVRFMTASVVH